MDKWKAFGSFITQPANYTEKKIIEMERKMALSRYSIKRELSLQNLNLKMGKKNNEKSPAYFA